MEGIALILYVENKEQRQKMMAYLHSLGIEPSIKPGYFDTNTFKFEEARFGPHSKLETLPIDIENWERVYKNLPERIGCMVEAG